MGSHVTVHEVRDPHIRRKEPARQCMGIGDPRAARPALQLFGLIWSGPSAHYWQNFLQRVFEGKSGPTVALQKVGGGGGTKGHRFVVPCICGDCVCA